MRALDEEGHTERMDEKRERWENDREIEIDKERG